jgi:hypothetical protein
VQLCVDLHGWQFKASKLCWLKKIEIYIISLFHRKSGEGDKDTKGLSETKAVVKGQSHERNDTKCLHRWCVRVWNVLLKVTEKSKLFD